MEKVIRYKTERANIEVHIPDLTDEERAKRKNMLEQAAIKFYKDAIKSGFKWPEEETIK